MELYKEDLFGIGIPDKDSEDNTFFALEHGSGTYVAKIILREVLRLWNYEIKEEKDIVMDSQFMLGCYTNMPWSVFKDFRKSFVKK